MVMITLLCNAQTLLDVSFVAPPASTEPAWIVWMAISSNPARALPAPRTVTNARVPLCALIALMATMLTLTTDAQRAELTAPAALPELIAKPVLLAPVTMALIVSLAALSIALVAIIKTYAKVALPAMD
jgi:hypothetical protein